MQKRILVLCSSSYQILVAIRIMYEYYANNIIDLLLTDTIADVKNVYHKAKRESIFRHTYLWKIKGKFNFDRSQRLLHAVQGWRASEKLLAAYEMKDKQYDVFLYANNSPIAMHLGNVLKHKNPNLAVELFEDGFSTYSTYMGDFLKKSNLRTRLLAGFFMHTSVVYVFNPQMIEWNSTFELKKICHDFEGEILGLINRLFSYERLQDNYNKKVIFFEESYAADGKTVDDVEIVEVIADVVGKENVFVKIHPRNPTNRFSAKGYVTNINISIPWEVIVLNEPFEQTVLVTLASNAAMNPYFLFGKRIPVILLFRCTKTPEALYAPIVSFDEKICSKYPDIFTIPKNCEQMKSKLKEYI